MKKLVTLTGLAISIAALAFTPTLAVQSGAPAASPDTVTAQHALLKQYCITCHSDRARTGGLSLENLDLANPGAHAETWEKVVRKLRAGLMPPTGAIRPDRPAL